MVIVEVYVTQNYFTLAHDKATVEKELHKDTIVKWQAKYVKVVNRIKHLFEQQNYDVGDLILCLATQDDDNVTVFSSDDAFKKVTSLNLLFQQISNYCNMYDYEILTTLVEAFECETAMQLLDDFSKELQNSILNDLDLLSEDGELRDIKSLMPGTFKLEIKYLGSKFTENTQKYIKRIMYETFRLKANSIVFRGVQQGCVALIYQISATVKSYLLQYSLSFEEAKNLSYHKIKYIEVDGAKLDLTPKIEEVCTWVLYDIFSSYIASRKNSYCYLI